MNISQIKNIAVIGLGTMGPGIAQTFAQAGYKVIGYDLNPDAARNSQKVVAGIVEILKEFDLLSDEQEKASLNNIAYTDSLADAVKGADIVVEVVSENRDIKRAVYSEIGQHAPAQCQLWSNTSTLNIYELVPESRLANTIIAHWFAPPHIVPLVEVVKDPRVSPQTVETTLSILKQLNKITIVMEKYVPGFAINRIQRHLGREIFFLLDGGYISPEDLDMAVKASIAPRMMVLGLVQRYDFTGLDLSARNLADPEFFDPPIDNNPPALASKIERGDLGVKTGCGFFDYSDRELSEVLKERDRYLLRVVENLRFCLEKKRLV
ncbi:MAG: 3-hydroxyacyl-CoA dehydrogenase family protein [Desulfarculaceae bacterium]|jgi:3-hydroxybutyryl-CoA dehydrogenase